MDIFTIDRKQGDFTQVYNEPFRDRNLSLKARGFIVTLLTLGPGWDFSVRGIQTILKENESAIRSVIKELMEAGYCHRYVIKDEKKRIVCWHYAFSEFRREWPEEYDGPLPGNPVTENPLVENPKVEIPHLENQGQYNTKRTKQGNNIRPKDNIYTDRDFLAGLIALGVTQETADAWMVVRHKAKAVSTRVAFDGVAREVAKSGLPAEDCIRTAVERSWRGFKAEWLRRDTPQPLTPSPQRPKNETLGEMYKRIYRELNADEPDYNTQTYGASIDEQ